MDTNDLRPDDLGNEMPETAEDAGSIPVPADSSDPSAAFTFVLPSDPYEGDDTAESGTPQDTASDSAPESPSEEEIQGETVIFEAPVKEDVSGSEPVPGRPEDDSAKSPDAGTPDLSKDAVEAETVAAKNKSKKAIWITVAALVLLLALGCGWFFLLGPGAEHYTVTFDTDGGNDIKPVSVVSGKTAKLPVPERDGYDFKGWTLNGKGLENPFTPESDVTVKAQWEGKEFTVYFNSSGGTPGEIKKTFRTGDDVEFPADPVKTGYTLAKWNDADGKEFKANSPMPPKDLYLFADWIDKSFKITFDTDGGTPIQPLLLKEGAAFPAVSTTKENYTFDHWEDPKGNTVKQGDILPAQDTILHAKWKRNTFKVSFDSRGGSDVAPINVNIGDTLPALPTPTRKDYIFGCWEDKNGTAILQGALLDPHDITLYARWEKEFFTVTFDSDGGTDVPPVTVKNGDRLTLPPAPTRMWSKFIRWEDKNGNPVYDQAMLAPEDITLYAVWESVTQLSVHPVISEPSEIESVVGTDTFLNINIYSNYSTTSLEANMDVTWEITDDYGCLYSVNTSYPRTINFVAVHNAEGCYAEIKAIADDGQSFRVTVYPIEGTPSP